MSESILGAYWRNAAVAYSHSFRTTLLFYLYSRGKMSIENLSAMLTQAVQALQGYLLAAVRYLSGLVSA